VGSVDFGYLESFLGGDRAIAAEVLRLFRQQGEGWMESLARDDADGPTLAHTIKGAARGIGANGLGEICDRVEFGAEAERPQLRRELGAVLEAIDGYLARAASQT
jgi:HPt (histidine-containing phosphotransfer) domain-containing protein